MGWRLSVVGGLLAAAVGSGVCAAQEAGAKATPTQEIRRVGTVDLFGYSGWNGDDPQTVAMRQKLSARVGAEVRTAAAAGFRRQVQGDAVAATGKPATDVAVICCNDKGELNVFVGMQGESSIPLEQQAVPTGDDSLPPEALKLVQNNERALREAEGHGLNGEDDAQGYALSQDPAARAVEEQMRTFAAAHLDVLVRVVQRSGAPQQRRAAAELLGYAQRSPVQVRALQGAMADDDDDVRNNAIRALAVLASAGPLPGLNTEQIVGLLYSGVWTDRNKASTLLLNLTAKHDGKLLKTLAEQALPPLIEGAQWQSKPHAYAFAIVLARVLGMPDEKSIGLFNSGQVGVIVEQAKAMVRKGAKR